ncbi:MAG: PAS domain-containing sensor histidine kinase [Sedimentisphaerales bacterium]|nr:PAS domain-containing sensor histidine kinase [Sedimentisphaerales bacterium]
MVFVFFIYGLAFFILGFAILLYPKRSSKFELAGHVNLIAGFGIFHGINEWIDMFVLINKPATITALEIGRLFILPVSFLFLLFFGCRILAIHKKYRLFKWLPAVLVILWSILLIAGRHDIFLTGGILSRYLFCFPGAFLTAYALSLNVPEFKKNELTIAIRNIKLAAAAFFAYSILAGLIVPPADFFPASVLNYPAFTAAIGVPIQLFRALCAIITAYSMIRVLSIFNWEAQQALRETELRFSSIAAGAPVILFIGNNNRQITFIEGKSLNTIGIAAKEVLGRSVDEIFAKSPQLQNDCGRAIEGQENVSIVIINNLIFEASCSPLREQHGNTNRIYGFIGVLVDITQRMQVKMELDKYRDELIKTKHLASLGTMSATMAQELDKPLGVARVLLERAMSEISKKPLNEELAGKWLKGSWDEVLRAASAIEHFYAAAHITPKLQAEPVDLYQIVQRIIAIFSDRADKAMLKLLATDMDIVPYLRISSRELEQIFFIMIQNVIETADGKRTHQLIISCREENGRILLTFADDCGGIAAKNIGQVFEPFSILKTDGKDMGFELAIVKRIVTAYNGDIRVESEYGKETTFYLTLPIE